MSGTTPIAPTPAPRLSTGSAAILRDAFGRGEATGLLHRSPPIEGTGAAPLDAPGDRARGGCR